MSKYVGLNVAVRAECCASVATILETEPDDAALMARASALVRASRTEVTGPARPEVAPVVVDLSAAFDAEELERLGSATPSLRATPRVGATADRARAVVEAAAAAYDKAAQEYVVGVVQEAVGDPDIDFGRPRVRRGRDVVTLDARRGHSALLVRISGDGTVERDWLVGPGEDCGRLDAAFDAALRRRGLDFDRIVEDHHGGRQDGARLFGPALARDPGDPARGAVLDAELPLRPTSDVRTGDPRSAGSGPAAPVVRQQNGGRS